jgi:small-conductance mechanosensitive channel
MEGFKKAVAGLLREELTPDRAWAAVSFVFTIAVIFVFFSVVRKIVARFTSKAANPQVPYLIDKALHYAGVVIAVMTVFNRLGINFSALLGAAGVAGIAVGFAAQTSVSNVISGFFVMTERAFKIGDILQVDSVTGVVEAFDLLSVRLRTFDNQFVRIPNETIIKTNLVNITHYPTRRFNLVVGVSHGADLERVREVLLKIAADCAFAVSEPEPVVIFDGFDASSIKVILGVWGKTEDFLSLKNAITLGVWKGFREAGISIPFPQLDVTIKQP